MAGRLQGKIKFFHAGGRYGFIIGPDGHEYYYRENDLDRSIKEIHSDDPVEFNSVSGMKGPRAVNVKLMIEGEKHDEGNKR